MTRGRENRLYPDAGKSPYSYGIAATPGSCGTSPLGSSPTGSQKRSRLVGVSLPFCAALAPQPCFACIRAVPPAGMPELECSITFRATANNIDRPRREDMRPPGK